jgi:hypothetical protein
MFYLTIAFIDTQLLERLTRKTQSLREKGTENGGSSKEEMAELPKDAPLVSSAFFAFRSRWFYAPQHRSFLTHDGSGGQERNDKTRTGGRLETRGEGMERVEGTKP